MPTVNCYNMPKRVQDEGEELPEAKKGKPICEHGRKDSYFCKYCHMKFKNDKSRRSAFCNDHDNQRNMCLLCHCKHNMLRRECTDCNLNLKRKPKCEHGIINKVCAECYPCEHGNSKPTCLACNSCIHGTKKSTCKVCVGKPKCPHNRQKGFCKECGGNQICPHNRYRSRCKDCGGSQICIHKRLRATCRDCKGSLICIHDKWKRYCVDCGGASICSHGKIKYNCKLCKIDKAATSYDTQFAEESVDSVQFAELEEERLLCAQCEEFKDVAEFIDESTELQLPSIHCNNCKDLISKSKGSFCSGGCRKFLFGQASPFVCQECKERQTFLEDPESYAAGGTPSGVLGSGTSEPRLATDLQALLDADPDF